MRSRLELVLLASLGLVACTARPDEPVASKTAAIKPAPVTATTPVAVVAPAPAPAPATVAKVEDVVIPLSGPEGASGKLVLPRVTGIPAAASAAIDAAITMDKLTEQSLEDIKQNYAKCACGVVGATYRAQILDGLVSLQIDVEFQGAYSEITPHFMIFRLDTGEPVTLAGLLTPDGVKRVAAACQKTLADRVAAAPKDGERKAMLAEAGTSCEPGTLANFRLTPTGLAFLHDFGFAHAFQAYAPEGEVVMTWAELGDAIDPAGPLASHRAG